MEKRWTYDNEVLRVVPDVPAELGNAVPRDEIRLRIFAVCVERHLVGALRERSARMGEKGESKG
jgi:hypothetical protein